MHDLRVTGYLGTPSFLMNIISRAEELGYDFRQDFSLRIGWMGAEAFPPSLKKIFREDYRIDAYETYGMSEFGLPGYECSQRSGIHIVDELLAEIVDPATGKQLGPGEVGEVVITPFNEDYPLIRFGTGDLSSYTAEPCPCGRTSPRISGIMGRVGDSLKVRGVFVHPKQVQAVVVQHPEISRFQVVIGRRAHKDEMTFRLELADEAIDRERLSQALGSDIKDTCQVKLDRIEFVARGTIPEEHKVIVDERVWE